VLPHPARSCSAEPEPVTSEADALGRLWGWECGHECAYKASDNTPLQLPVGALNVTDVQPVTPADMVTRVSPIDAW
jgi:hypothetical protein